MPHDRSRLPSQTAGSTVWVVPSTRSSPSHDPIWAKRWASSATLRAGPERQTCGSSSTAGWLPCQVRSKPTPWSSPSHTNRTRSRGSRTSTRNGPTDGFRRSCPSSASEARTLIWRSPTRTVA